RIREGARAELQQAKLASLGTMAAGLAHELNNPASAARRAAQNLCETLQAFDQDASRLLRQLVFRQVPIGSAADGGTAAEEGAAAGDPFQPIYDVLGAPAPKLDAMSRSEREDELADWLEEEGVEAPWEAADTLVTAGFTQEMLEAFSEGLVPRHRKDFLTWLPRDVEMRQLAEELAESTRRISELVTAMKAYTYMDRGEEQQEVDLHRGLEDTLTILQHKLRRRSIEVVRSFGELPAVRAYGGELNQVWTNLLDNAIAAVPDAGGRVEIRTRHDQEAGVAQVEIEDNGPGISDQHLDRIFEPFFTTKEVGEGMGLGLDIVHRIVKNRHRGTIDVRSQPGKTLFCVRLPVGAQEN
ncbi:MAG: HAMP domain-containing sensor histidine kinase, partial [Acidobacteriota bacterium]|nr:HAMP domain-containing sensor histidine kinase [Acidobacteriota bacterium]